MEDLCLYRKMGSISLILLLLTGFIPMISGAKILGLTVMPSKSHDILIGRLMKELAKRGHEVIYLSPFPEDKIIGNLTRVWVDGLVKAVEGFDYLSRKDSSPLQNLQYLTNLGLKMSEIFLSNKEVRSIIFSPEKKFDLILTEAFLSDGVYSGISWTKKAPIVGFGTLMALVWHRYMVGNPAPYSFIPEPLLGLSSKMTFQERLTNTLFGIGGEMYHRLYTLPNQDAIMRKHFGENLPPLEEIVKNVSLVLINHHYSLAFPKPYLPNMIEVGGLHVDPPKHLPKDLQKFMDDAKDGVILFSLGSNLRSSTMPEEKKKAILNAFSRLKQKVLWKFESQDLLDLPPNVLLSKWLPQSDILAHPNLKVFITHGGLLSTTEAVHRGVPVIGIPIFGDQPINMKDAANAGFGISLEYNDLTSDLIVNAVNEILNNPKYTENVKMRSAILKDTPLPPLENAVFWVEYVIRHKGAPHFRSSAQDLKWHELVLWDVAFVVIGTLSVFLAIFFFLFRALLRFAFCKKNNPSLKKKKS